MHLGKIFHLNCRFFVLLFFNGLFLFLFNFYCFIQNKSCCSFYIRCFKECFFNFF